MHHTHAHGHSHTVVKLFLNTFFAFVPILFLNGIVWWEKFSECAEERVVLGKIGKRDKWMAQEGRRRCSRFKQPVPKYFSPSIACLPYLGKFWSVNGTVFSQTVQRFLYFWRKKKTDIYRIWSKSIVGVFILLPIQIIKGLVSCHACHFTTVQQHSIHQYSTYSVMKCKA